MEEPFREEKLMQDIVDIVGTAYIAIAHMTKEEVVDYIHHHDTVAVELDNQEGVAFFQGCP